jgi:hypothetical protein
LSKQKILKGEEMSKKFKIISVLFLFVFVVGTFADNLLDMIKKMNEDLLKGYTQSLITSFGTATGSGLYHTAATHKLLGFDIGVKAMWVTIPDAAKTFEARVLALSPAGDTTWVTKTSATIFGEKGRDSVIAPSGYYPVIPALPGGLDLPGFPFAMPQLSVGLVKGVEIMVRYIPIPVQGADVQIFGAGLKLGLNNLLNLKLLPVDVAVQGVYQVFNIGDIIKSSTFSVNVHASKTLVMITPYIGLGFEKTKMNFEYTFNYQIPGQQPAQQDIKVAYIGENNFRAVAGISLKLAILLIHADYNLTKYPSFSGGLGFSLR